jgi:hypothetical protein
MATIELDNTEFGQLMFILANAEGKGINWSMTNPLLMKIGDQVRQQAPAFSNVSPPTPPIMRKQRENSKETGM